MTSKTDDLRVLNLVNKMHRQTFLHMILSLLNKELKIHITTGKRLIRNNSIFLMKKYPANITYVQKMKMLRKLN